MSETLYGTVFNIEKFHMHDGQGIRTLVFLKGCVLDCPWCCNPESKHAYPQPGTKYNLCAGCGRCTNICPQSAITMHDGRPVTDVTKCCLCGMCTEVCGKDAREIYGKKMTPEEIVKAAIADKVFYRRSSGGVTFSGGEPCLQADFVERCSFLLQREMIDINVETCGAVPYELLEKTVRYASLVLLDIKLLDQRFLEISHGIQPSLVTDNLKKLRKSGKQVRLRCPIIPGYNYEPAFIEKVIALAQETKVDRVDLLPFHQFGRYKHEAIGAQYPLRDLAPLKEQDVEPLRLMIEKAGLTSVIGG